MTTHVNGAVALGTCSSRCAKAVPGDRKQEGAVVEGFDIARNGAAKREQTSGRKIEHVIGHVHAHAA